MAGAELELVVFERLDLARDPIAVDQHHDVGLRRGVGERRQQQAGAGGRAAAASGPAGLAPRAGLGRTVMGGTLRTVDGPDVPARAGADTPD